jgi:hypothetical protein
MTPPTLAASRRAIALAAALLFVLSLGSLANAQRLKARFEWQDREVVLDYGVARLGKHTLEELPVGGEWRLGNNNATTLATAMPVVSGDAIVPPGSYRVKLLRPGDQSFAIAVEGADQGKGSVSLPGEFKTAGKPKEQLAITWSANEAKPEDKQNRTTTLSIQFGTYQLTVPALLIGTRPIKAGGWEIDAFTYPAALVEKQIDGGRSIPVAVFRRSGKHEHKEPDSFNLFVSKSGASLVPSMVAPTDSYGFGEIAPPDPAWTRKGSVAWDKSADTRTFLEIASVELNKNREFTCTVSAGGRAGKVTVKDPYAPAAAR